MVAPQDPNHLKEPLNEKLGTGHWTGNYTQVKVLVLYWEHSRDENPYKEEGRRIGSLFDKDFNFDVEYFEISYEQSHVRLHRKVLDVLSELDSLQKMPSQSCLLVVHYGGHGDPDDDRGAYIPEERRAVWRPDPTSSSRVRWWSIQHCFAETTVDVLLLFDCCFGAQAGRDQSGALGRFELLTAAAMGVRTPTPGERSFTAVVMREIRAVVKLNGWVRVTDLHRRLTTRHKDLYTTPFYINLGLNGKSSICLRPLTQTQRPADESPQREDSIRLLIRTSQSLDDIVRIEQVAEWLRRDVPDLVKEMRVEEILLTTSNIRTYIQTELSDSEKSIARSVSTAGLNNIRSTWTGLTGSVLEFMGLRRQALSAGDGESCISERLREGAQSLVEQIEVHNDDVVKTIEESCLENGVSSNPDVVSEMIDDPLSQTLGIRDKLILRRIVQSGGSALPSKADTSTEDGYIKFPGTLEEYKSYGEGTDENLLQDMKVRVELLAKVLSTDKRTAFRSLVLHRWTLDRPRHRFVYHFEIPEDHTGDCINLYEAIKTLKGDERPSLGDRFAVACNIATAVQHWHSVGWLHQGISAYNILFFRDAGKRIEWKKPFLQGFDFARPACKPSLLPYVEDIRFNVYRHPNRQGPSRDGHRASHDIYSLGVVLLELGLWYRASDIVRDPNGKLTKLNKSQMCHRLQEAAHGRLAHCSGRDYQEATLACIQGNQDGDSESLNEREFARTVQVEIIDKLAKCKYLR